MKLTYADAGFIKKQAEENWKERAVLMQHMKDLCEDDEICEAIHKVDKSFIRKLYNFPGDITTHRIHNVLTKIGA
jgi:hypothetical protein